MLVRSQALRVQVVSASVIGSVGTVCQKGHPLIEIIVAIGIGTNLAKVIDNTSNDNSNYK